jgi:hypothetical protein
MSDNNKVSYLNEAKILLGIATELEKDIPDLVVELTTTFSKRGLDLSMRQEDNKTIGMCSILLFKNKVELCNKVLIGLENPNLIALLKECVLLCDYTRKMKGFTKPPCRGGKSHCPLHKAMPINYLKTEEEKERGEKYKAEEATILKHRKRMDNLINQNTFAQEENGTD